MSDKPLYDELMNMVTEIGGLEVENGILKNKVENLTTAFETSKKTVEKLIQKRDELELALVYCETGGKLERDIKDLKEQLLTQQILASDLLRKIDGAGFKARLRYLFTCKL